MTPLAAMLDFWNRDLHYPRDRAKIKALIGVDPQGYAWCGRTAQAAYRAAGLNRLISFASVYKVRAFAQYKDAGVTRLWCVYRAVNAWCPCSVRDLHASFGQPRVFLPWGDGGKACPGDLTLHESKPGAANGHVMLFYDRYGGTLHFLGGNQKGQFPDGTFGKGITKKAIVPDDTYPTWIVRPSPLDFDPDVTFCRTEAEAVKLAAQRNGGRDARSES